MRSCKAGGWPQTLSSQLGAQPPTGLVPLLNLSLRSLMCKMGERQGPLLWGLKWKLSRWRKSQSTWLLSENCCCCPSSLPSLFLAKKILCQYPDVLVSLSCCNKYCRLGRLPFQRLGSPWSRGQPVWFLVRAPFLASFLALSRSSFLCLFKATNSVHEGSTLSKELPPKVSTSKYFHLRLQRSNFRGRQSTQSLASDQW